MENRNNKKRIVFIGTYAGEHYLRDLVKAKIYTQTAANQTEGYYIKGLNRLCGKVSVLSALVLPSFPKSRLKFVKEHTEIEEQVEIRNVGFFNFPIIRFISQFYSLEKEFYRLLTTTKSFDEEVIIIVYSMRLPFLMVANKMKRKLPKAKIINIIPDLPIYMHTTSRSFTGRAKAWINQILLIHEQKTVDGF